MKKTKSNIGSSGGVPIYQLMITLKWSRPAIWRRVLVRADLRLDRLHHVIQIAMGWTNSHLHQFLVGRVCYGEPEPDFAGFGMEKLNERRFTLADLAPVPKKKFLYEYDFGDGWMHEVTLGKVLPPDTSFEHPVCRAGKNACPPEDCGGIGGYYAMLDALADPRHRDHAHFEDWLGEEFDSTRFDLDEVNAMLKRLKA